MPDLYIITGSNGAGKSTLGPDYLPDEIVENYKVFDGDLLYTQKLKELFPEITRSHKYAAKDALSFVVEEFERQSDKALSENDHYVYEGHFTNDETWSKPQIFKMAGYRIHLIFFGLDNPSLSQSRVTDRVTEGGHYVDPMTLEGNFFGNLQKLNKFHKVIDDLLIVDTSEFEHRILYKRVNNNLEFNVVEDEFPQWFTEYLPDLVEETKNTIPNND